MLYCMIDLVKTDIVNFLVIRKIINALPVIC